jgi:F-type H+-transporting ATPase subunit delta
MAELTTIARPYAEAVARLAKDGGSWAAWSDALSLLASIAADPQVSELAGNPDVPGDKMAGLLLAVAGDRISTEARNFVLLLVENKRLAVLPEIVRLFEEMKAAQEGVLEARVITAFELTTGQLSGLVAKLEARFGQKVTATQEVDASLIGGVIVHVGDEVLDASVRGKIAEMAATLKA